MSQYKNILFKIAHEFLKIHKYFGYKLALYNLLWWINFYIHTPFRHKLSKWALTHKTQILTKFIESNYNNIIFKYSTSQLENTSLSSNRIWVFWGQGEESMPVLINSCYKQLKKNNPDVILLTNDNICDYISLSPVIIKKVTSGRLSWAHFSDIIRTKILYIHGGLWLDATVWTPKQIPFDKLANFDFFSANGHIDINQFSICFWTSLGYNWSTWCLWAGKKNISLYGLVSEIMERVAIDYSAWPDYVFQDFLFYYAVKNLSGVKDLLIQNNELRCLNRNTLANLMDKPFDKARYDKLIETDFVFKLSFRTAWPKKTPDGKLTYYGKLIDNDCD